MSESASRIGPVSFTFPLGEGNYPFALEGTEGLTGDQWAWAFLRRNPLYRHDFRLAKGTGAATFGELKARYSGLRLESSQPPRFIQAEDLAADSRYFCDEGGAPLHKDGGELTYTPMTLGQYLRDKPDDFLQTVRLREMDVSSDYGLGHWVDPDTRMLEAVTGSWFFHLAEPIWETDHPALRPGPLRTQELKCGDRIYTAQEKPILSRDWALSVHNRNSTLLRFLVCLDGNVEHQVERIRPIAEALKAAHEHSQPDALRRGYGQPPSIGRPTFGTRNFRPTNRVRRNWVQVQIDVASGVETQFAEVTATLKGRQVNLDEHGLLSFPLRQRRGSRNPRAHWLKRALCVLELHISGVESKGGRPVSQERMAEAFYNPECADYWDILGLSKPLNQRLSRIKTKESAVAAIRNDLELARDLCRGWYEHLEGQDDL